MPPRRTLNNTTNVPTYDSMLMPTIEALKQLGGSGTIQEIGDQVVQLSGYSEDQQRVLHGSGPKTEIMYRLAWSRTYLRSVGAVENSKRGVWSITDYGRLLTPSDVAAIPARVRALRFETPASDPRDSADTAETMPEPSDRFTTDEWRDRLLIIVQCMPPDGFERLCQRILRESNFTRVEVTGKSGDGGIDGIGVLRINLISFHVFFQCKRYRGSVGASAIRDFRGAMIGRTDKGLFITTGTFTADAKREATRDGAPVLDLIDGDQLCSILKSLGLGVATEQVEATKIDAEWFTSI